MSDSKPAPPAAGDPRFTTTVTLAAPTGTPDLNTFYIFTNSPVPGTTPSVGVPPTHNAAILGVNIGLTVLALVVVILRVFSRWKFSKPGWDDLLISFSVACAICIMSFQIHGVHEGMGKHIGDLTNLHFIVIEHYHWLSQIIYCVCIGLAKISMCVFLLRFHPDNAFRYLRKAIIGMIGFVTAFAISSTVATICTCRPIDGIWSTTIATKCVNRAALIISISTLNILTDLIIVLLPIPMLLKVQLPLRQKLTLTVIFCLGLAVCVASAIRMSTLHALTQTADASWEMARFSVWTALEFNLAIICASAPAIKPLIRHYSPKILGSSVVETAKSHLPGSSSKFRTIEDDRTGRSKDSYMMTKISGRSAVISEREARQNRFDGRFDGRREVKTFYSGDASSDEMILGDGIGITRTIEIDIKSLDADEGSRHHGV